MGLIKKKKWKTISENLKKKLFVTIKCKHNLPGNTLK